MLQFIGSQRVGHDWSTELNCAIQMLELVLKIHGNDYFVAVKFNPGENLLSFPWQSGAWNRFLLVHPSAQCGLGVPA